MSDTAMLSTLKHKSLKCVAFLVAMAVAGSAIAAPRTVCATYAPAAHNSITLEIATGCVSSSYRYQGHDFKASINPEADAILVEGEFKYQRPDSRIVKRDCGSHRRVEVTVNDAEARSYKVIVNDKDYGVVDFSDSPGRQCIKFNKGRLENAVPDARNLIQ